MEGVLGVKVGCLSRSSPVCTGKAGALGQGLGPGDQGARLEVGPGNKGLWVWGLGDKGLWWRSEGWEAGGQGVSRPAGVVTSHPQGPGPWEGGVGSASEVQPGWSRGRVLLQPCQQRGCSRQKWPSLSRQDR